MSVVVCGTNAVDFFRWRKLPVLNDGYVCLVDVMGDDSSIVQAARVSYGAGTKSVSEDRTLIRYLMRHKHWTPFEMCEIKVKIRLPIDVARQWWRHRTASINEYSTRYSEAINSYMGVAPDEWRLQATQNKQGSSGECLDENTGTTLTDVSNSAVEAVRELYDCLINEHKVSREVARRFLPLGTYTEAYWKCDLRNLFHFLELRLDEHAQQEIREYAKVLGEIVKQLFPIAYEAFEDYCLNTVTFSKVDLQWLQQLDDCLFFDHSGVQEETPFNLLYKEGKTNKRELMEFSKKVQKALDFGRNYFD